MENTISLPGGPVAPFIAALFKRTMAQPSRIIQGAKIRLIPLNGFTVALDARAGAYL